VADRVPRLNRLPGPQQRRRVRGARHRRRVHKLERQRGGGCPGEHAREDVQGIAVSSVLRGQLGGSSNGGGLCSGSGGGEGGGGGGGVGRGASLSAARSLAGGPWGSSLVRLHRVSSRFRRRSTSGSHRRRRKGPLGSGLLHRRQHPRGERPLLGLVEVECDLQRQRDVFVAVGRAQQLGQQRGERRRVVERDEALRHGTDVGRGPRRAAAAPAPAPAEQRPALAVQLHEQPQHCVPEPAVRHQALRDAQAVGQGPGPVWRAAQRGGEPVEPAGVEGHADALLRLPVAEAAVEEALNERGEPLVDGFGGGGGGPFAPGGDVAVDARCEDRLRVIGARGDVEERTRAEGMA